MRGWNALGGQQAVSSLEGHRASQEARATGQTPFNQRGPGTSMRMGAVQSRAGVAAPYVESGPGGAAGQFFGAGDASPYAKGSPGAQGPPGQAGAAGPGGNPGGSMGDPGGAWSQGEPAGAIGDPGVGSPQDFWELPGQWHLGDFSMGTGWIMGDRPYVPGAPYSDWSRPNPARPPRPSGFNPLTPPGGWGPAGPGGFPLPTPPTVTPGPSPPQPRPVPGPPPVVLPQILQGARDAMDWAQDAYAQDPTVQAIDEMERESAELDAAQDPSPRYPDANRVRNRNEMKRDWARRKTEEAKARQAQ